MAFEEVNDIPITRIDTVIEVLAKGDGSHEADQVMVSSTLQLAADIDASEEALLLLPLAGSAQGAPLVRYTDEHVKDGVTFAFDPVGWIGQLDLDWRVVFGAIVNSIFQAFEPVNSGT